CDLGSIRSSAAMHRPERVAKGPLTLASPHQSINGITPRVILRKSPPKRLHFRVMKAKRPRFLARQSYFLQALNTLEIAPKNIFVPAKRLHPARTRLRKNACQNVKTRMVRRLN